MGIDSEVTNISLPLIDIYLNPDKFEGLKKIVAFKKQELKDYFNPSNMKTLYPNLFKVLWFGSLPCSPEEGNERFMIRECKVGNEKMNCSEIFQKIPTDSGMCCALNVKNALRESVYTNLVADMQTRDNARGEMKVLKAKAGKKKWNKANC